MNIVDDVKYKALLNNLSISTDMISKDRNTFIEVTAGGENVSYYYGEEQLIEHSKCGARYLDNRDSNEVFDIKIMVISNRSDKKIDIV